MFKRAGLVLALAAASLSAPAQAAFTPGTFGLGDPFFDHAGNGGYDVSHYALTLAYDPATRRLEGHAAISATATQDLSRFDLDLRGFDLSGVTVDGRAATFLRDGQELVITPARPIRSGTAYTVVVDY